MNIKGETMTIFILILALILAIVAVTFALQNPLIVTATFFTYSMKGSLALFVLIGVGVGVVIGLLVLAPSAIKNTFQVSGHRQRIGALEKELEEHKAKVAELQKPKPVTPSEPPKPQQ
jgi:uncharacterized membrane protein YciS (DUF1049 family)